MKTVLSCFLFAFITGVYFMSCKTNGELAAMPKPLSVAVHRDSIPVRVPRVKSPAEIQFLQQIQDLVSSTPKDMQDIKASLKNISESNSTLAKSINIIVTNDAITRQRSRDLRDAFEAYKDQTYSKLDSMQKESRASSEFANKAIFQRDTIENKYLGMLGAVIKFCFALTIVSFAFLYFAMKVIPSIRNGRPTAYQ